MSVQCLAGPMPPKTMTKDTREDRSIRPKKHHCMYSQAACAQFVAALYAVCRRLLCLLAALCSPCLIVVQCASRLPSPGSGPCLYSGAPVQFGWTNTQACSSSLWFSWLDHAASQIVPRQWPGRPKR